MNSVKQSGKITPGHVAIWTTTGVVQDGGSTLGGYPTVGRPQRSVTTTPIVVAASDQILNCNIGSAAACGLPLASGRNGLALTFVDLGQALDNPITLTAAFGDTILNPQTGIADSTYVISRNYQVTTLVPFDDAVNTGWTVQ